MMDIDGWLSSFGAMIEPGALKSPEAAALVSFVNRYAGHIASLVEIRSAEDRELVVLCFRTGRPQQSAYPIKHTELIGVRFAVDGAMPIIYMLRPDFPDTPHQQLTLEGSPRAICIDDRPWPEARLTWTPAELVQRTLIWFDRAARGKLHDARQPIDPVLSGSPFSFVIPRTILDDASRHDLIGSHDENHRQTLRVMSFQPTIASPEQIGPVCVMTYRVPPEEMTRMQFAPTSLNSLSDTLKERGIDLFADLSACLGQWFEEGEPAARRLNPYFVVIVEMPIVSPNGEQQDGVDLRAYMTDKLSGEIAVALGVELKSEQRDQVSSVGYVKAIVNPDVDAAAAAARDIEVQVAAAHYAFDRTLAKQLSGRATEDNRKTVLVGAGAIGSHVSDCLIREGRFSWTVIDDDCLLPHNLARHTGNLGDVMKNKAQIVAEKLSATIYGEAAARAINENILSAPSCQQIDDALNDADIIIDATTSMPAERFLSDHPASARRVSVFFNPTGTDAVLLAEPADRSVTLRDLEAQYLGLAGTDERLAKHLATGEQTFTYTGACRAITNLIPESQVMTLSGLVAGGLGQAVDTPGGALRIWSLGDDGCVDALSFVPQAVTRMKAHDWTVTLDAGLTARIMEMRRTKLPNETGGILFGVIDIPAKSIHIVAAEAAPPDSQETATGFTRGTVGVQEHIDRAFDRTRGQVRYIGEWHSHPPCASTHPSMADFDQIGWLAALFDMDTLPALMLIAGDLSANVILANTQAVPVEQAAAPEEAGCQKA